jgi:uroporphyrinogen-III decarboxylase
MFSELFGPLVGLDAEWRKQGATEEEIGMTAFGWDYVPVVQCGGQTGVFGGFEPGVVEETDEYLITRDDLGRRMKLRKGYSTIPLPLDYPVTDWDSWLRMKPMLEYREERIDWAQVDRARKLQSEGHLVVAYIPGGFDLPRQLMGEENACLGFLIQPDLIADIIRTMSDTSYRVLEQVSRVLTIDQLSVHEDLAGKTGPLVGPNEINTFIRPYFRRIWDLLSSRGTRLFDMDTDGNVNSILDSLLECGLNSMHPFEPAAGMDIVEVRKKYGNRLAIRGGIDKHVLRKDHAAIRAELEYKMQPMMQAGGTLFGLDHRIPNGTPLENYKYYVALGRQLLNLPPLTGNENSWGRMAF